MRYLSLLLFIPIFAFAQTKDVLIQRFDESFNPASTRAAVRNLDLLVGLRFGGQSAALPTSIKIANPDTPRNNVYCLSMRTRDGLYSANAGFAIQNYSDKTIQFDLPSKYNDNLKAYNVQDIATLIFEQKNCEADKSTHFVPALSPNLPMNALYVMLNAPNSRLKAQITQENKPLTAIETCTALDEGARVGYTSLCKLTLSKEMPISKQVTLFLSETTQDGKNVTRSFQLSLPYLP